MKRTLKNLWNGSIAPGASYGQGDPQLERLNILLERNREALERELGGNQKVLFEEFAECADEFTFLSAAHAFCDGFSLASKLLIEALSDD